MVSPETIIFFIRASIRLSIAANDAIQQGLRDRDAAFPGVASARRTLLDEVQNFFLEEENRPLIEDDLAEHWETQPPPGRVKDDETSRQVMVAAYFEAVGPTTIWRPTDSFLKLQAEPRRFVVLAQWAPDTGPPSPWLRIGYALLEVGLDYVGTNPQLISAGGKGDRLIQALVRNVREMLPDVDDPNWQQNRRKFSFAERAMTVFLRAGLRTLESEVGELVEEKHLQELAKSMLNPLVAAFAGEDVAPGTSLLERPQLVLLRDTLLGPVTTAAFSTLAENPEAFFGRRFATERAIGALTQGLLRQAADPDFRGNFPDEAPVRLYRMALEIAVQRPELFLKGDEPEVELGRQLIADLGDVLLRDDARFQDGLVEDLAAASLRTFAEHGTALLPLDANKPWHKVAMDSTNSILNGLAKGLEQDGAEAAFRRVFSRDQATELGRIVLEQAAVTPAMLTGGDVNPEIENILAGVAAAMAKDEKLLLSGDDWLQIAATATQLAARNPGCLFGIDATEPHGQLGVQLISTLLKAASEDFKGRAKGSLLFGTTLRETIRTTLLEAVGNVERATAHRGAIETLAKNIDAAAKQNGDRIGADEWLFLFGELIAVAIAEGETKLNQVTAADMLEMLKAA
jgi:hypothetical protein